MSEAIISINGLGAAWVEAMGRAAWQGAVVLLLVLLVSRLLPRLSPPLRAWLWRLAFLKLLLGLVSLPPVVLPVLPAEAPPPAVAAPAAAPTTALPPVAAPIPPAAPQAAPAAVVPPAARLDGQAWLLIIWAAMTLAYAAHLLRCWGRARRLRQVCQPVGDGALTLTLTDLCRRAHIRPPPLLIGEVATPLLLGLRRPAIVLPRGLDCREAECCLMLAHEVAHLRRRDLLWNWLPLLAQGLFLFHPLVWLGRKEWTVAQEMACDADALALTAASEAEYGEMLVKMAVPPRAVLTDPLVAGIVEPYHTLRRRLRALVDFAPVTRRRLLAGGLAIAVLGLLALVPWQAAARGAREVRGGARVVVTIPYGSGSGQVGPLWTPDGIPELAALPPTGPTAAALPMVQQAPDGTVWVLDVVNGRVLAFTDGKQTEAISLASRHTVRTSFAVTPSAVFVVEGGPAKHLTRYDRARRSATSVHLRLPNGEEVMPLGVTPLGARGEAVMVAGARGEFRVEADGRVAIAATAYSGSGSWSSPMPGADGALWRFRGTSGMMPEAIPGAIDRYDAARTQWMETARTALPKQAATDHLFSGLGVDERGDSLYLISEGTPDFIRFVHVDRRGKVLATFALRDLGLGPQLGYAVGGQVQGQLLPDGDLLLLAAAPEGYRVLRIRPPATSPKPAPLPLSRQVAQFVARFTRVSSPNAAIRSDTEVSTPMVQAAEELRADADRILAQCRTSPANSDAVAAQLLAPLEAYARKYRPGSKIDEALLENQHFAEGESPGWYLPADAYLLLELAGQQQSASFTRRALTAVADAAAADGYLWQQRARHDHPNELVREMRQAGGYHTQTVDALAWCAEYFLTDAYQTPPSYLPPAARKEIDAYIAWRHTAAGTDPHHHGWLPSSQAFSTLTYARRVAEKLPE